MHLPVHLILSTLHTSFAAAVNTKVFGRTSLSFVTNSSQSISFSDQPPPFRRILDRYDGVFCNVWSVIHNGIAAFFGAADALRKIRASGRFVIVITNALRRT